MTSDNLFVIIIYRRTTIYFRKWQFKQKFNELEDPQLDILFYPTNRGRQPVYEWLQKIQHKQKARYDQVYAQLLALQENGNLIRSLKLKPDGVKKLKKMDIWQLRVEDDRILFFFDEKGNIVLTNQFQKKSKSTPPGEIERAEKRRREWLDRNK